MRSQDSWGNICRESIKDWRDKEENLAKDKAGKTTTIDLLHSRPWPLCSDSKDIRSQESVQKHKQVFKEIPGPSTGEMSGELT